MGLGYGELFLDRILGRIRGTLKREPLLNALLALLKRGPYSEGLYIFKGPPNPIPYRKTPWLGVRHFGTG